jgi:hypothetical protein
VVDEKADGNILITLHERLQHRYIMIDGKGNDEQLIVIVIDYIEVVQE